MTKIAFYNKQAVEKYIVKDYITTNTHYNAYIYMLSQIQVSAILIVSNISHL